MNHTTPDPSLHSLSTDNQSEAEIPLGKTVFYPSGYDASLLFPIPRVQARQDIGIGAGSLPFIGSDLWNAYEMSWLNSKGLPQVAILRITVPCTSPNIIESKSFKLYLNGFNQTRFISALHVLERLKSDLSQAAQATVSIEIFEGCAFESERIEEFTGINLDQQDIEAAHYLPEPALLKLRDVASEQPGENVQTVSEAVFSRLLKSNCPVTQQPDWACLQIQYTGRAIDHAGLLKYIVSFRMHSGFHENCVERMFMDIMQQCQPTALCIFARYTRRGGLDINPWRATAGMTAPVMARSARQ